MHRFLFACAFLVSSLTVVADDQRYVAVVGVGEAQMLPDTILITITIDARAPEESQASARQLRKADEVLTVVKDDLGPDIDAVSNTSSVQPYSIWRQTRDGRIEEKGYRAQQTLVFRMTKDLTSDLKIAQAFYRDITQQIDGIGVDIGFMVDDLSPAYSEARALAVKSARMKAVAYAAAMDADLGDTLIIEESGSNTERIPFALYDRITGSPGPQPAGELMKSDYMGVSGTSVGETVPPLMLAPDLRSVAVTIYAKFALE